MTLQQIRDQRSKLLFDAHALASTKMTAESRAKVDQMLADANELKADEERMARLEAALSEQRSSGRIPRDNPDPSGNPAGSDDPRSPQERRSATNKALRAYFRKDTFEQRDLTVSANGSVMIPVGVTDPKLAMKSTGSIYDIVGKLPTATGEAIKVPYLNDVNNGFVLNSAAITTTDPATGGATISIDDTRMNPILIENSLLQDISFDMVGYIEKMCRIRYIRSMSNWIVNGNTSNLGGLIAGYTAGVTGNTTLVTKYADLTALLAALDPAYAIGACFVMNNFTLASQILNILDGNGRPIFLPFNDGGISGFAGTIFGYPVKLSQYHPNNGVGNEYIQFGNFDEGYTLREVDASPGIQNTIGGFSNIMLKRTDERYIELNKVGFVAFARVGGAVTAAGSTSGTPLPIVTLTGR